LDTLLSYQEEMRWVLRNEKRRTPKYLLSQVQENNSQDDSLEFDLSHIMEFSQNMIGLAKYQRFSTTLPAQWINCDVRSFDFSVLGTIPVIHADPPWDISMNLPYGLLRDIEIRRLPIQFMQKDGVIFLWVTSRAFEVARGCLEQWGYNILDEITWIKLLPSQRINRFGFGPYLGRSKEHCIVAGKGDWNKFASHRMESDVIISERREISRKPDEIYSIIDRIFPGVPKCEIFGRKNNLRPGWITIGNQLDGTCIHDENILKRFNKRYNQSLVVGKN
jgi:mRNA (2'-O-methyladenosine-N6-)-methyltransferase